MSTKELSGRELNLEIAQRLMGYRWFHCVSGTGVERNQFCSPDQEETWRGVGWKLTALSGPPPPDQFNDDSGCPLFGSSIEAAMRVVERLIQMGHQVSLSSRLSGPRWQVNVALWEDGVNYTTKRWQVSDESLPKAICHAALTTEQKS